MLDTFIQWFIRNKGRVAYYTFIIAMLTAVHVTVIRGNEAFLQEVIDILFHGGKP